MFSWSHTNQVPQALCSPWHPLEQMLYMPSQSKCITWGRVLGSQIKPRLSSLPGPKDNHLILWLVLDFCHFYPPNPITSSNGGYSVTVLSQDTPSQPGPHTNHLPQALGSTWHPSKHPFHVLSQTMFHARQDPQVRFKQSTTRPHSYTQITTIFYCPTEYLVYLPSQFRCLISGRVFKFKN